MRRPVTLRNHIPKKLCIFLTGGAYAPYATCMATPLHTDCHWRVHPLYSPNQLHALGDTDELSHRSLHHDHNIWHHDKPKSRVCWHTLLPSGEWKKLSWSVCRRYRESMTNMDCISPSLGACIIKYKAVNVLMQMASWQIFLKIQKRHLQWLLLNICETIAEKNKRRTTSTACWWETRWNHMCTCHRGSFRWRIKCVDGR